MSEVVNAASAGYETTTAKEPERPEPKILQQLADAISSMASTQALMGYTLIVFAVGTLVCFAILGKYTVEISRIARDIHAQTTELLKRSTP